MSNDARGDVMTLGRRDVLKMGGLVLMAGTDVLSNGGEAAAASASESRAALYALPRASATTASTTTCPAS
jgi:hypothetical protein